MEEIKPDEDTQAYIDSVHQKMLKAGYKRFSDSAHFSTVKNEPVEGHNPTCECASCANNANGSRNIVAIFGDRFMNGGWISKEVLKKAHKQWNGTLHDINHMGTHTGFFLAQSDITYFIGYHTNVKYHKDNKSVSMELNVHNKTKYAEAWEAYVELCGLAGKIPNVSVTYYGIQAWLPTSELPKECDWKAAGYGKDDLVPVLTEIQPVCVSTVLQGRCDDKGGCGIRDTNSDSCDEGAENATDEATELDEAIEKKRQELITLLKKDD